MGYDLGYGIFLLLAIYVACHIIEAVRRAGRDARRGTWMRPRVAPKITRWKSPVLPPAKVKKFN